MKNFFNFASVHDDMTLNLEKNVKKEQGQNNVNF